MSNEFMHCTDEELVIRALEGNKEITDYLLNKYKNLVKAKAGSMFILGGDRDDLIQEGMIGLYKAIRDYDAGRDASFHTFADLCITRQIYTAVQASGRKKHQPLNTYVSINGTQNADDSQDDFVIELENKNDRNPEDILIDKENVENIEKVIDSQLSPFERQVLDLTMTGMGYAEVAKILGKDEKSTDNALTRVKSKLKKYFRY